MIWKATSSICKAFSLTRKWYVPLVTAVFLTWCTRLRSFRSRATPLPIQVLHTWQAAAVTWLGVSSVKAGRSAAPTWKHSLITLLIKCRCVRSHTWAWNCSNMTCPGNSGSGTVENLVMTSWNWGTLVISWKRGTRGHEPEETSGQRVSAQCYHWLHPWRTSAQDPRDEGLSSLLCHLEPHDNDEGTHGQTKLRLMSRASRGSRPSVFSAKSFSGNVSESFQDKAANHTRMHSSTSGEHPSLFCLVKTFLWEGDT